MIAIVMIGLLLLVGLGLGLYFFVFAKKDCKKITEEDECTEPCQWDTYGDKCIGEKDTLTAAPTPTPTGCSTYTTQDTCVSPCEWDSATDTCGSAAPAPRGVPTPSKLVDGISYWQEEGGHPIYLDRQNMDCGDTGINKFKYERKLSRPNDPNSFTGQAKYTFKCHKGFKSTRGGDQYTPPGYHGDGSVIYLDKHNINCGDKALERLFVRRDLGEPGADGSPAGYDQLKYLFNCGSRPLKDCEEKVTAWVDDSEPYQEVLANLDVSCPEDKVLTRLQMTREKTLAEGFTGNVRYEYKCCGK